MTEPRVESEADTIGTLREEIRRLRQEIQSLRDDIGRSANRSTCAAVRSHWWKGHGAALCLRFRGRFSPDERFSSTVRVV